MLRHLERFLTVVAAACFIAGVIATPAYAQGYGLYEQSACQMGRAGAGVAAPCDDGSAMFFNPAGLAENMRPVISGGATGIAPRGTFTDNTTKVVSTLNAATYPVPNAYAAAPVGRHVMVGVGLFAPYGLTSDWPPTSEGRFLGYYSSLKSVYVQPTLAARLSDNVMIGFGLDITHTSADLRQRVDLSTIPITGTPFTFGALGVPRGTDFADVKITGNATHVGGHVGFLIKGDRAAIGLRYLFRQTVPIDNGQFTATQIATGYRLPITLAPTLPAGTPIDAILAATTFAKGGALSNQTATTNVPLPDQFVVGIAFNASDRTKVFADYQYTHWQLFDALTVNTQFGTPQVTTEQYGNTNGFRLGIEHIGAAIYRLGFDAHDAAAPDQTVTPRLPEAARWELALGLGLPVSSNARIDFAYQYVHQQDRAGRTGELPNNGQYHYYANLYGANLVLLFGRH